MGDSPTISATGDLYITGVNTQGQANSTTCTAKSGQIVVDPETIFKRGTQVDLKAQ